ncbi:MAG: hypothetical protein AAGA55_02345 [Planctomycetota bacterium]
MSRRSIWRNAFQLAGFIIGLGLLIWCVRIVLSEENRGTLERLRDASAWEILLLLSVAASSIILNGIIFWVTIRPLHNIRVTDMIATNGICTFLSYLPFKVSVIARWLIHGRRDGVPTLTIGTWFLVVVGLTAVTIAPMMLAFVRPASAGWWWWIVIVAAIAAAHWAAMAAARWLRGETGLRRLRAMRFPARIIEHRLFRRLHDGTDMVGDAHTAWIAGTARVLDIGGFTLRIGIAAAILGVDLTVRDTVLIGLAYFVTGVVSPFGTVGTREATALVMAHGVGVAAAELQESALITAILLVTLTDAMTSFFGAGFGLAWLRADRLLFGRGGLADPADDAENAPSDEPDTTAMDDDEPPTIAGEDRDRPAEPDRR